MPIASSRFLSAYTVAANTKALALGLAVCRKIVERHNGSITAQSSPGKGSTFLITLPIKQPA